MRNTYKYLANLTIIEKIVELEIQNR